jgi:ribonuclease HI
VAKKKYYAVVTGRKPGIYDEWFGANGAEAQVKGLNSAVYKSFASHTEAENWYKSRSNTSTITNHLTRPIDNSGAEYLQLHQEALETGKVIIYTDGGCDGNPGKGSYGVVLLHKARRKELSGGYAHTTNNRMELMAAIAGLETLTKPAPIMLFSDSAYLIDAMQKGWVKRWKQNDWQRNEDGSMLPVKNADLWQRLFKLSEFHDVRFVKVRGHAGIAENERCHILASQAMQRADLPIDEGYTSESAPF